MTPPNPALTKFEQRLSKALRRYPRTRFVGRWLRIGHRTSGSPDEPVSVLIAEEGASGLAAVENIALGGSPDDRHPLFLALWFYLQTGPRIGDDDWRLRFLRQGYKGDIALRDMTFRVAKAWWDRGSSLEFERQALQLLDDQATNEQDRHLRRLLRTETRCGRKSHRKRLISSPDGLWVADAHTLFPNPPDSGPITDEPDPGAQSAAYALAAWSATGAKDRHRLAAILAGRASVLAELRLWFIPRRVFEDLDGVQIDLVREPTHAVTSVADREYVVRGDREKILGALRSAMDKSLTVSYGRKRQKKIFRNLSRGGRIALSQVKSPELRELAQKRRRAEEETS